MVVSVIDPTCHLKKNCPVVYWLSGLTCTDRNFVEKAGAVEAAVILDPELAPGCTRRRHAQSPRGRSSLLLSAFPAPHLPLLLTRPLLQVKHGVIIVCPDTSPRGVDIEGDSDSSDFGKGAGFYGLDDSSPLNLNLNLCLNLCLCIHLTRPSIM